MCAEFKFDTAVANQICVIIQTTVWYTGAPNGLFSDLHYFIISR